MLKAVARCCSVCNHRHSVSCEGQAAIWARGADVDVTFTPHENALRSFHYEDGIHTLPELTHDTGFEAGLLQPAG